MLCSLAVEEDVYCAICLPLYLCAMCAHQHYDIVPISMVLNSESFLIHSLIIVHIDPINSFPSVRPLYTTHYSSSSSISPLTPTPSIHLILYLISPPPSSHHITSSPFHHHRSFLKSHGEHSRVFRVETFRDSNSCRKETPGIVDKSHTPSNTMLLSSLLFCLVPSTKQC